MKNYIIREAKIEDLKKIQELSQELIEFEKNMTKNEYLVSMNWALSNKGYENYKKNIERENDFLYVVCINENIIGYMTCWINNKKDWDKYSTLEIGNIYVKEKYRGKGIGTELINTAKKICKEKDIKYMQLKVLSDNSSAINFYRKNGLFDYILTQYVKIE